MAGVDVTSPVPSSGAVTIHLCKISHPEHVRSELDLPLGTSVPALDIFLCCQDCLARTESERAFYAAAKSSSLARLFIFKR